MFLLVPPSPVNTRFPVCLNLAIHEAQQQPQHEKRPETGKEGEWRLNEKKK
jgi:hypothetical protein